MCEDGSGSAPAEDPTLNGEGESGRKGRSRRVVEGLSGSYLSFAVNAGLRLLVTPFYLSRLGAELMGFQSFIRETINYFQLMDVGIGTGLTAIVAKDFQPDGTDAEREEVRKKLRAGGQLQFLLALIAFVLSLLLAAGLELLAQGLPAEHLKMARICAIVFGLTFAVQLGSRAYKSFLVGTQQIGVNAVLNMFSALLGAGIGVVLVAKGWSLYGLAVASMVAAGFYFVQVRWRSRRLGMRLSILERPLEVRAMRDIAGLSGWILVASAGGLLSLHSARLILGILPAQGMTTVNMYALLMAAPSLIRIQANRVSVIVRPGLTQLAHGGDGERRARRVARLLVRISALLGAMAFLGVWQINGAFVIRWVGGQYYAGDGANLLAAVLTGLSVALFSFRVLMEVRFDYRKRGLGFLGAGIITVVLSLLLAPSQGIQGVLVAAILGELVVGALWFVPTGVRWIGETDHPLSTIGSMFWVPVAVLSIGVVVASRLEPVVATWPSIFLATVAILGTFGLVGSWWMWSDLREYLGKLGFRRA